MNRLCGIVHGYTLWVNVNTKKLEVWREGELLASRVVSQLPEFLDTAKNLRIGWGKLPDYEVIYLYDKDDDYFGYALNITDPDLSEWGYAPFSV